MATLQIPYGSTGCSINIPDRILGEVVAPNSLPAQGDLSQLIEARLSCPTGTPPLEALVQPGQTAALIIDDISRPTPAAHILPPVINRLLKAGLARKDIFIVIALGSHRPLTSREIVSKVGLDIASTYVIVNTPCDTHEAMQFAGNTAPGIPAHVNKQVLNADIRIGIGAICPHMDTGFSGGGKIILPGVCSCSTVNAFHAASAEVPGNQLGNPEAPARLRMEAFVGEKVPLDFIVNVILHPNGEVYQCVAGHFVTAHRRGVHHAQALYGVKVKKQYPLVIANSYPFEIDFWQCTKAFWSGELMTSDRGMVVLISPCPEGTTTHPLWEEYLGREPNDLITLLHGNKAEDPSACAFAIMLNRFRERVRFGIISPAISRKQAQKMKLTHFDTIEQAVKTSVPPGIDHTVSVITHGGVTLPLLPPGLEV